MKNETPKTNPAAKMVYIYVCKRFKLTMEMVSGKDGDWVNNLLQYYCKHARINAKLERAEINPKKRTNLASYDSSTDVFKINLVYKDAHGVEHELKWVIKVTRTDVNETADLLLRHEKLVYSRLMGDLMNTVKQRSAGRLEGSRISFGDLLQAPEFIFEETAHQADQMRNVLVLENLEEKDFFALQDGPMNLCHMRSVVKTIAKFHAVSLTYKATLFAAFKTQQQQVKAARKMDEVVMESENRVLTGREGLFSRFPFLGAKDTNMSHLIKNRHKLLDMFEAFLENYSEEPHLLDIFEYIRISADDILGLSNSGVYAYTPTPRGRGSRRTSENKATASSLPHSCPLDDEDPNQVPDCPLDSIALGILEARSFLFRYEEDENKENEKRKKNSKLQRSQSERIKDRSRSSDSLRLKAAQTAHAQAHPHGAAHANGHKKPKSPTSPASAKCPKLERGSSGTTKQHAAVTARNNVRNKFLQNVIGRAKDDVKVPLTGRKTSRVPKNLDPNTPPKRVALVNTKYVTYDRITKDLAVIFWTSGASLVRRFYLIKMVEVYVETLGITLGQLGIDTDSYGLKYQDVLLDFQQLMLYGFLVSVLIAMATTSPAELESGGDSSSESQSQQESDSKYFPLTPERIKFMLDLIRDIGSYVESKDFELGLPITNFARYHELWSMEEDAEDEVEGSDEFDDDEFEDAM